MKVSNHFLLTTDLETAWTMLSDVKAVVTCIPGMTLEDEPEPDVYLGSIAIQFGPTKVIWRGRAAFSRDAADHIITIDARGADGRKASRAKAAVSIAIASSADSPGSVVGRINGSIDISGPLSAFANTGGAHVLTALLRDFEANFESVLSSGPHTGAVVAMETPGLPNSAAARDVVAPAQSTINGWRLIIAMLTGTMRTWFQRLHTAARRLLTHRSHEESI